MQAYSMDLRVRVMADVDSGMSTKAVAEKHRVRCDWVRKLIRFRRETGDFGPRKQRVSHATKLDDHLEQLERLVADKPGCHAQRTPRCVACISWLEHDLAHVCVACSSLLKKVLHAEEQMRPDVQQRRTWWQNKMMGLDPRRFVFIDETGVRTNMDRHYGRSRRGRRLVGRAPHGHWKTTTFVAALRHDGLTAPMVVDGAMNSAVFMAYIRYVLLPTLRPGEIVVMDNLSSHKASRVREAIESVDAQLAYEPASVTAIAESCFRALET